MMTVADLDTPALLVDLDILERNLARVAEYARGHGLGLRPHTKTHKSSEVAKLQLQSGAIGLSVAKVGEAEALTPLLPPVDLLVAFPIFGAQKVERLRAVTRKSPVTVAIDSLGAARQLEGIGCSVLVEIDVGLGRVGVTPAEALVLAREIEKIPGLRFRGLTFYPGHIKQEDEAAIRKLSADVGQAVELFRKSGHAPEIVSGGSTPALFHSHEIEGLNEIRPGTYVYNDLNTVASGACTLADCAASILVTVVSTPRPHTAIVDGGSKTFSSDRSSGPDASIFGRVNEVPGTRFHKVMEEHGFLDTANSERELRLGERLRITPNHICVAVNLHEKVYGIRGDEVERVWQVEGRGRLQ